MRLNGNNGYRNSGFSRLELSTRRLNSGKSGLVGAMKRYTDNLESGKGGNALSGLGSLGQNLRPGQTGGTESVPSPYDNIKSSAQKLGVHNSRLLSTDAKGLLAGKKETDKAITTEVKDFVEDYNRLVDSLSKVGGHNYKTTAAELKTALTMNKEDLAAVGLVYQAGGKLTIDSEKLEKASIDTLKKIFQGEKSLGATISAKVSFLEKRTAIDKIVNGYDNGFAGLF